MNISNPNIGSKNYLNISRSSSAHTLQIQPISACWLTSIATHQNLEQNLLNWASHNQLFQYLGVVEMASCCATVYLKYFHQFSNILKQGQIGVKSRSIAKISHFTAKYLLIWNFLASTFRSLLQNFWCFLANSWPLFFDAWKKKKKKTQGWFKSHLVQI